MKRAEGWRSLERRARAFGLKMGDGHGDNGQRDGLSKGKLSLRSLILLLENSFLINPKILSRTDCPL